MNRPVACLYLASLILLCPLQQAEWGSGEGGWGTGAGPAGLGHVSSNGGRAGPFHAVTVNLFDLSLCKSLRRLKAFLLDCAGKEGGGRFPLCLLDDDDDNQVCFWPCCGAAIISCCCLSARLWSCVALQSGHVAGELLHGGGQMSRCKQFRNTAWFSQPVCRALGTRRPFLFRSILTDLKRVCGVDVRPRSPVHAAGQPG